jgi:hypothetical protein
MDVERTIESILKRAARFDARFFQAMDRADKRMEKLEKGLARNSMLAARLEQQIKQADFLLSASIRASGRS